MSRWLLLLLVSTAHADGIQWELIPGSCYDTAAGLVCGFINAQNGDIDYFLVNPSLPPGG